MPSIQRFVRLLALAATSAAAQDTAPSVADSQAIAARTDAYFDAVGAGDPATVTTFRDAGTLRQVPPLSIETAWLRAKARGLAYETVGALRVTWYPRPEGLRATVDDSAPAEAAPFHCGHVAWKKVAGGPRIVRVESFTVAPERLATLDQPGFRAMTAAPVFRLRACRSERGGG